MSDDGVRGLAQALVAMHRTTRGLRTSRQAPWLRVNLEMTHGDDLMLHVFCHICQRRSAGWLAWRGAADEAKLAAAVLRAFVLDGCSHTALQLLYGGRRDEDL